LTYPLDKGNDPDLDGLSIGYGIVGDAILEEGNPICTELFFYLSDGL